jgi:hypothetical protein
VWIEWFLGKGGTPMTRQDVGVVAVVALATAAVAVGTDLTGRLVAANSPQAEIRWPVLKQGQFVVTLRGPQNGKPAELEAVNTGTETRTFQGTLTRVSESISSVVSRVAIPESPSRSQSMNVLITLCPGEKRVVPYAPDAKLQPRPNVPAVADNLLAAPASAAAQLVFASSKVPEAAQPRFQSLPVQGTLVYYVLSDGKNSVQTQPTGLESPAGAVSNSNGLNSAQPKQAAAPQVQASR